MNNGTSHRPKTMMTANAAGMTRIKARNKSAPSATERKDDPEKQRRQRHEKWDGQQPGQQQRARDDRVVEEIAHRPAERRAAARGSTR